VRAVRAAAAAGDSLHVIHVYARGRAAVSLTRPSTHGENGKTHTHPPVSAGLLPHFRKETPPHYHPWDGGICNLRRICSPGQSGRICKSVPTWRRFTVVLLLDGMMSRTRLARRVGWLSKSDRDFRQGRGGRGNEAQADTRDGLAYVTRDGLAYVTRDGLAYVSCKARSTRPSAASPSPPVQLITNYLPPTTPPTTTKTTMDASDDPALEFRAVFGTETKNPYSKSRVDEIQQYRALLDNELFFDHLLASFAQISDGKPPPLPPRPPR
jgi:hypothetical protein